MKSILVVDDEAMVCDQFAKELEEFGIRATTAYTVESALCKMGMIHFDAILVEFNLRSRQNDEPRTGNGLHLVRKLRTETLRIPIFVHTAMEGPEYLAASRAAGADAFILKTAGMNALLTRLRDDLRPSIQIGT
jgi:DNA-binding response OmpR family regulator